MKEIGVYVHIPFCKQRCYYCDFISFANQKKNNVEKYVKTIIEEIKQDNLEQYKIRTIYFGGRNTVLYRRRLH